jgi:thiamine biosynthesis lipoprotein
MRRVLVPLEVSGELPVMGSAVQRAGGRSMGTTWSVLAVDAPPGLQLAVQRVLDKVVAEMSHWDASSDLSRFNLSAPGEWHALPPDLDRVLTAGADVMRKSAGAFNPFAGALVNAWGFGPLGTHQSDGFVPPSADLVSNASVAPATPGPAGRWQQPGGTQLDLSGIAKGFSVDQVARRLDALGIKHYLVEVGGELRGVGMKPDGQPWWTQLETVEGDNTGDMVLALHGLAIATSGDYRRSYTHDGRSYSHTIDPRTGYPIDNGVASVTVVHQECMLADAWSTAITVLGADEGMALAEREGLAARILLRSNGTVREYLSTRLSGMLQ